MAPPPSMATGNGIRPSEGERTVRALANRSVDAGYFCTIRRNPRPDGVHFWHWKVTDRRGWLVASGTVYSSRAAAIEKARSAMTAIGTLVGHSSRKAS
jgi:hypothetical protein